MVKRKLAGLLFYSKDDICTSSSHSVECDCSYLASCILQSPLQRGPHRCEVAAEGPQMEHREGARDARGGRDPNLGRLEKNATIGFLMFFVTFGLLAASRRDGWIRLEI